VEIFLKALLLILVGIEAIIDIRKKEILLWPLIVMAIIGLLCNLLLSSWSFKDILSGLIIGVFVAIISIVSHGGIGMGDAVILMVIGIFLGFEMTLQIFFWSLVAAAMVAMIYLIRDRKSKGKQIAFIPFIFIGMAGVFICNVG